MLENTTWSNTAIRCMFSHAKSVTLAMECEKWKLKHITIVNDTYRDLGAYPKEKNCILETLRVYFRNPESVF